MTLWRFRMPTLRWAVPLMVAICFLVSSNAAEQSTDGKGKAAQSDFKRLEGKWIRPDGGYVLELKEMGKDGTLRAAYFNPRPINVAKAEFTRKDGKLTVFVELRDVNYPGSKYNLQYDPKTDRLVGTYFQAVESVTYEIEFVRAK
ncbi:MAG TPA: hypothetical protein VLD40_08535 [Dissulfurispiraceae bacterium]|nr:hypothetical protein [Dissulfurispiraceae bacterium]